MMAYAVKRLAATIPLVIGLSIVVFVGVRLLPGDPVSAMLGVFQDPTLVAMLRHRYGLDQPILQQYLIWATGMLHGDFGLSVSSQMEIGPLIAERLPATLELMAASMLIAAGIAIPAGIVAGMGEGKLADKAISVTGFVGLGTPAFLLGMILIAIFSIWLRVIPSGGYIPLFQDPVGNLRLLILPALANGLASTPYLLRLTRAAVIEVKKEPFVGYATAKGLRERTIYLRYIVRNILPSLSSVLGLYVGLLLAGSITIEILFSYPGMARLFVGAVDQRDYALVEALILVYGVLFIVINLAAELVQALLDPRIRLR